MASNIWELLAALFGGGALLKLLEAVHRNFRKNKMLDASQAMGGVDFVIQHYQTIIKNLTDEGQKNSKELKNRIAKLEQMVDVLKEKHTDKVIEVMDLRNRLVTAGICVDEDESNGQ